MHIFSQVTRGTEAGRRLVTASATPERRQASAAAADHVVPVRSGVVHVVKGCYGAGAALGQSTEIWGYDEPMSSRQPHSRTALHQAERLQPGGWNIDMGRATAI